MKHLVCLYNPQSGTARSPSDITTAFKAAGIEVDCFAIKEATNELQETIKDGEYEGVIAAGGDGTVNSVAGIALAADLPLGVLPLGTLNHFAKDVGIPQDFSEAVDAICRGKLQAIDYCTVNNKLFLNNASMGMYPSIVLRRERRNYMSKLLATSIAFVAALFKNPTIKVEVTNGNFQTVVRSPLLFIGNNHYELEKPGFTSRRGIDAGQLFLYIVKTTRVSALLFLALLSFLGIRHRRSDVLRDTHEPIIISAEGKRTVIALDGEIMRLEFPLTFTLHAKGLRVYVPAEPY